MSSLNCQSEDNDLFSYLKQKSLFQQKSRMNVFQQEELIKIFLSADEESIYIKAGCCRLNKIDILSIANAKKVQFISNKDNNKSYIYSLQITTYEKKQYNFLNISEDVVDQWVTGIAKVIKKKLHETFLKEKSIKYIGRATDGKKKKYYYYELDESCKLELWTQEIIKNWQDYRELLFEETNLSTDSCFSEGNNLLINKYQINKLWLMGLPSCIRKNLWNILLEDQFGLNAFTFECLLKQVSLSNESCNSQRSDLSERDQLGSINNYNQSIISDIKNNIEEIYNKMFDGTMDKRKFIDNVFKIIRTFNAHRPEIMYCCSLAYIGCIIYSVYENVYEAFVAMVNFIIPNYFYHFLSQKENTKRNYEDFFNNLLSKRMEKLNSYLKKKQIEILPFFMEWAEYLFSTNFPLPLVLRIWDNFLLKGYLFLFKVSISYLQMIEGDIYKVRRYISFYFPSRLKTKRK